MKDRPSGVSHLELNEHFGDDNQFRALLPTVKLGFLRMKTNPTMIPKLFEGWFILRGQKWYASAENMPAAFKAKPDVVDAGESEDEEEEEAPPTAPRRRLRGKMADIDRSVAQFIRALLKWLGEQPKRTATSAGIMRFLRRQPGFPEFARKNPDYNRATNIVSVAPETFETIPGGSFRNPRIRLK